MSMLEGLRKLYTAPSYGNEMKIVAAEIDRERERERERDRERERE